MHNFDKEWQVESQGVVYEADIEELGQWIVEAAVLPSDLVRRGDLRWLPAAKVPQLQSFINSLETSCEPEPIFVSNNEFEPLQSYEQAIVNSLPLEPVDESICFFHTETAVDYVCDVCEHFFCKNCPKSFGGTVKICPLCDSLCRSTNKQTDKQRSVGAINKPYSRTEEEMKAKTGQSPNGSSLGRFTALLKEKVPAYFST